MVCVDNVCDFLNFRLAIDLVEVQKEQRVDEVKTLLPFISTLMSHFILKRLHCLFFCVHLLRCLNLSVDDSDWKFRDLQI